LRRLRRNAGGVSRFTAVVSSFSACHDGQRRTDERECAEQAVEPIEETALPRQGVGIILETGTPFHPRGRQVPHEPCHACRECKRGNFRSGCHTERVACQQGYADRCHEATEQALDCLAWTDSRGEFATPAELADNLAEAVACG